MRCCYACRSAEHVISRRSFLGEVAAGLGIATGLLRADAALRLGAS